MEDHSGPKHGLTFDITQPDWGQPEFKLPTWVEPLVIAAVLFGSMWLTRRRGYRIFGSSSGFYKSSLDQSAEEFSTHVSSLDLDSDHDNDNGRQSSLAPKSRSPKTRSCLGLGTVHTPNSSRYKNNVHSRVFQRFPFLVEMFYWIITWAFYRTTWYLANELYKDTGIWHVAEKHALSILELERFSRSRWLFPIPEIEVQRWFTLGGHTTALSIMNRAYSLIHIPGTAGFIAWYYYVAPSHATFAIVRRTMTLTNFMAFLTFIFCPVMPPRLLPKEYGFLDTVHRDDAQSVWMSGRYVNALAAMPSMHLGYSFSIGCTLIYHSGLFRKRLEKNEVRKNRFRRFFYFLCGALYPISILMVIIATANHYWLDAIVSVVHVCAAFWCNKIFNALLVLEDWFLFLIQAEKPIPSTGQRVRASGGRKGTFYQFDT